MLNLRSQRNLPTATTAAAAATSTAPASAACITHGLIVARIEVFDVTR
jgi:hypothetical protein